MLCVRRNTQECANLGAAELPGARGDFNTEYTEFTEFGEGMEERVGRDRGARRTARGETEETRMHEPW